jgi:hypothetical protein
MPRLRTPPPMTTTTTRPPIPCPDCGSHKTKMLRTYIYSNGVVSRDRKCSDCGRKFKHFPDGGEPPVQPHRKHFDDATFRRIILGTDSLHKLSVELGCSYELIRSIRCGKLHRHRMPDIQRLGTGAPPAIIPDGPSCWHCSEWRTTRCAMGFPDPEVEGPSFAKDCSLYAERSCR